MEHDIILRFPFYRIKGRRAIAQNPNDVSICFQYPDISFEGAFEFEVNEEVTQEFAAVHPERLDAVTPSPVPQHQTLTFHQLSIKRHFISSVTHEGREGGIVIADLDRDRCRHING